MLMSNPYSDSLLESIDIICDSKIKKMTNIEVIIGEIIDVINASKGIYQIKYQNAVFVAYSDNTDYIIGNSVLILTSQNPQINYILGRINF